MKKYENYLGGNKIANTKNNSTIYSVKVTSYDSGGHYISETTSTYERVGG